MVADVNLFGGPGGAVRGGGVGRPTRGGVRSRVLQTNRQCVMDSFETGENYRISSIKRRP